MVVVAVRFRVEEMIAVELMEELGMMEEEEDEDGEEEVEKAVVEGVQGVELEDGGV